MVDDNGLYLVDLHKTKVIRFRFSRGDEVVNLTHALTMIYGSRPDWRRTVSQHYGRPHMRPLVERGLGTLRCQWIESKKGRAFSTTSRLVASGNRVYVRGREETAKGAFVESIKEDRKVRVERHEDHIRKTYRGRLRLEKAWQAHVALETSRWKLSPGPPTWREPHFLEAAMLPWRT